MKIYFCLEAVEFQCNFDLRPSKVRNLVRTNQFKVKSTKMGAGRKFVTLQYVKVHVHYTCAKSLTGFAVSEHCIIISRPRIKAILGQLALSYRLIRSFPPSTPLLHGSLFISLPPSLSPLLPPSLSLSLSLSLTLSLLLSSLSLSLSLSLSHTVQVFQLASVHKVV